MVCFNQVNFILAGHKNKTKKIIFRDIIFEIFCCQVKYTFSN